MLLTIRPIFIMNFLKSYTIWIETVFILIVRPKSTYDWLRVRKRACLKDIL
jgi:hypothetical protein